MRLVTEVQKAILTAVVWLGLVMGLVEGLCLWVFQRRGWLAGTFTYLGSSIEIIWIATVFGLLMFSILGLALGLAARLIPRLPIAKVSTAVFVTLLCFDWLAMLTVGRVRIWGISVLAIGVAVQASRWINKRQERIRRFWRLSILWLGLTGLLALVGIQGATWLQELIATAGLPESAPGSANVLVTVVDTLRADHLSTYGYARTTSPTIDQISEQGVLFENAFSASSWTEPSHASLLTDRYPYEHGADTMIPLDDRYTTLGEVLQELGYRTGGFSGNFWIVNRRLGLGRGFQHFEDYYRSLGGILTGTVYGRFVEVYVLHDVFTLPDTLSRQRAVDINRAAL